MPRTFRDDLAAWQFEQLQRQRKCTYDTIAKSAGLSSSTVWNICSRKGEPGDPAISIVRNLYKSLGLKPEYALNFQLRKSEFHLAVLGEAGG